MEAAIFVSIPEYMLGVGRLGVVRSYVPCVFTVSDGYIPIRLAYIHVRLITGPVCYLIDATFLVVLCFIWFICVLAVFGCGFLSYCVGGSKCCVEIGSLNMLVIFLILGLKYVNVVHCLPLSGLVMLVFIWFSILG